LAGDSFPAVVANSPYKHNPGAPGAQEMILNCPHCENEFYVRDELAGETVNCHKCKRPVQAPAKPAPTSDNEGTIVTSFDFRQGAKPGMETKTKQHDSKVKITPRRGFRRLALLASVIIGPVIFFSISGVGSFTINDYLLLVRSIFDFGFFESANETVRVGVEFIAIWVSGFIVVWALYWLLSFLVRGFFDEGSEKAKTSG
jgi:predicted Zn finger-like uncharacterized protein